MDVETVQEQTEKEFQAAGFHVSLSTADGKYRDSRAGNIKDARGLAVIPTFPQASAVTAVFI